MAIDSESLAFAKAAGARMTLAELALAEARGAYRDSIRRIHDNGASLRMIATELDLSHQRVHQIVKGKEGWSDVVGDAGQPCSFCGEATTEPPGVLTAPNARICPACIRAGNAALSGDDVPSFRVSDGDRCSFCTERGNRRTAWSAHSNVVICPACAALAAQIVAEANDQGGKDDRR